MFSKIYFTPLTQKKKVPYLLKQFKDDHSESSVCS